MRYHLPPRFSEEKHEDEFEELCRDLFEKEPGIRKAEIYGRTGQSQGGIDILAYRQKMDGREVGECKCREQFSLRLLSSIVSKFLKRWSHWKRQRVRRFIVFAGCPIRDTNVQDAIGDHTDAFEKRGIVFEVWDSFRIAEKLRDLPAIAERHCGVEWARRNCGGKLREDGGTTILSEAAALTRAVSRLTATADEFRENFPGELEKIRELSRRGRKRDAFDQIEKWRKSALWEHLEPSMQARGLLLSASLHIDYSDDVRTAKRLLKLAQRAARSENHQVVEAAICDREEGAEAALKALGPPRDTHAFNLQLAFLLKSGRAKDVLKAMQKPRFPPTGRTYAHASLAALILGDTGKAETLAAEGLKRSPEWFEVRLHAAKLDYLATILPNFNLRLHLVWPIPADLEFLRRDSESVNLLRRAESVFADLLTIIEADDKDRPNIEGWRLACLADHPERRAEAESFAKDLLHRDGLHLPATIWSLERGLAVDRAKLTSAFVAQRGANTVDAVQALCTLHLQSGAIEKAAVLLDSKRNVFETNQCLGVWRLLRAQLAVELGNHDEADQIAATEPDKAHRQNIHLAVVRVTARKSGDFRELAKMAAAAYHERREPKYLFEACEASLEAKQPQFVSDHAAEVLLHFPTAAALQLVVQGTFDSGDFDKCLKLIQEHSAFFPKAGIPEALRRTEIECLRQTGQLTSAVKLADELVRQYPETLNLIELFQTQVSVVDLRAACLTARRILERNDVTSFGLLQLARAIHAEDLPLAIEFWQKAVALGLNHDVELANAVDLAFRLGLEDAVGPLMPGFYAMANKPEAPVKAFPIDEIRKLMWETVKQQGDVNTLYNESSIPVHLAVNGLRCVVADLFHENPRRSRAGAELLRCPPVLARHAARQLVPNPKIPPGTLFADISSILLAADADLLDVIERAFAPILISAHLPESLHLQIEKTMPHQPAAEKSRRIVLELVAQRELVAVPAIAATPDFAQRYAEVMGDGWDALVDRVHKEGGLLCDFVPPTDLSGRLVHLDEVLRKRLVSCGDVVAGIHSAGVISAEEARRARRSLGETAHAFNPDRVVLAGTLLVLGKGIASQLAGAGILPALTRFVRVEMGGEDIEMIRNESSEHERRLALVSWMKTLADRLQRGIQRGVYKTVTMSHERRGQGRNPQTPEEHAIFDLLSCGKLGAKVGWADDRYVNRYENLNGTPNYGINEVLNVLRATQQLSDDEYFVALYRLRSSNVRFLPIAADEIHYQLLRATIANQTLAETEGLTTLRRYIAACCLDRWRLRPPSKVRGRVVIGEFHWVFGFLRAIADTMARLWAQENLSEVEREIRADWLLDRLFLPAHGVTEAITKEVPPDGGAEGNASMIALLFSVGFMLPSGHTWDPENRDHPRARFYDWIEKRLINPMLAIEPGLVKQVAGIELKVLFKSRGRNASNAKHRRILRVLLLKAWLDLPRGVREAIELNATQRRHLGIGGGRWTVGAFGTRFDGTAFWDALARVWQVGVASIQPLNDETTTYRFTRPASVALLRRIPVSGGNLPSTARVIEPRGRILAGPKRAQQNFLNRRFDWIDLGDERRKEAIFAILQTRDASARVVRLEAYQELSAEFFYRSLLSRLRRREHVTAEESLPADAMSLCHHLRLNDERASSFRARLELCGARLVREIGLAWSIERFTALPVLLPEAIRRAVRHLASADWRALFARLDRRLRSPLSRLHLSHLVADRAATDERGLEKAAEIVDGVLFSEQAENHWKTFTTLLDWTSRHMGSRSSYRLLDSTTRLALAWLHAVRLHEVLLRAGVDDEALRLAFRNSAELLGIDTSACDPAYFNDATNSRFAARLPVLLRGFGAMISTLPDDIAARLRLQRLPWEMNEKRIGSAIFLLRDTALMSNALGSFLGGDAMEPLAAAINVAILQRVIPIAPSDITCQALDALSANPQDLQSWHLIHTAVGDRPLPAEQTKALESLISTTDFAALLTERPEFDQIVLHFATVRKITGLPVTLSNELESQVWRIADHFRKTAVEDEILHRRVGFVAACLFSLSVVHQNEAATCAAYHGRFSKLAHLWPESVHILRMRFCNWPSRLPIVRQRGIWELELTLRAMR